MLNMWSIKKIGEDEYGEDIWEYDAVNLSGTKILRTNCFFNAVSGLYTPFMVNYTKMFEYDSKCFEAARISFRINHAIKQEERENYKRMKLRERDERRKK